MWLAAGASISITPSPATSPSRMAGLPASAAANSVRNASFGHRTSTSTASKDRNILFGDRLDRLVQARIVERHDQTLALVIHKDGRDGRTGVFDAQHAARVYAAIAEIGNDPFAGGIIADGAPEAGFATQPGDCKGGARCHAFGDLEHIVRQNFALAVR